MLGVVERCVRHPARDPRLDRVEALDQQDLVGPLGALEEPPVRLGRPHRPRLALVVAVHGPRRHEVRLRDGAGVRHAEGVLVDRLDGAPGLLLGGVWLGISVLKVGGERGVGHTGGEKRGNN